MSTLALSTPLDPIGCDQAFRRAVLHWSSQSCGFHIASWLGSWWVKQRLGHANHPCRNTCPVTQWCLHFRSIVILVMYFQLKSASTMLLITQGCEFEFTVQQIMFDQTLLHTPWWWVMTDPLFPSDSSTFWSSFCGCREEDFSRTSTDTYNLSW